MLAEVGDAVLDGVGSILFDHGVFFVGW